MITWSIVFSCHGLSAIPFHLHTIYGSWDSKERCQMLAATNQSHGMKLKISQVLFFCKLRWLITLSTLSREFVSKWFPDRKLHINHLAQSDDMIYQLLLPLAFTNFVSSSYHIWKLRFQGGAYIAPSRKNVCKQNAT